MIRNKIKTKPEGTVIKIGIFSSLQSQNLTTLCKKQKYHKNFTNAAFKKLRIFTGLTHFAIRRYEERVAWKTAKYSLKKS